MLTFIFCALFACQTNDKEGFSTSGSGINPNETGPTTSDSSNDSNNGSGGGGGVSTGNLADADNEDSPQISGMDAFFTEYEGIGDLIEVHVYYTDAQDDLEGGLMQLSYSNSEDSGSEMLDLTQDNASLMMEENELTMLFTNVNTNLDYDFRVRLVDSAGNYSNEFVAQAPAN